MIQIMTLHMVDILPLTSLLYTTCIDQMSVGQMVSDQKMWNQNGPKVLLDWSHSGNDHDDALANDGDPARVVLELIAESF